MEATWVISGVSLAGVAALAWRLLHGSFDAGGGVEKIKASVDAVLKANQQQAQDLAEHATKMEHFGELIVRMDERQQNFASRMDERQQSFAKVVDELKSDMKDLRRGSGKTR